jgi:hypothetical protein
MPWPQSIQALSERVSRLDPNRTVDQVVGRMREIEADLDGFYADAPGNPDARGSRRPLPDGVACFNGLYLKVTEGVLAQLGEYERPDVVKRLDVLFAEFYFQAYAAASAREWVSKAWEPLFERKDERGVLPLQFAVAGMNAHINNDLALALVLTWRELGVKPGRDTPEHRDYLKVNRLLERVQAEVKRPLADDLIRELDSLLGSADDFLAIWSVKKAREDAWTRALKIWKAPDEDSDTIVDKLVGFASHLLLGPPALPFLRT